MPAIAAAAMVVALSGTFALTGATPASAAITAPFNQVFSANTNGSIQIRGNTVSTCQDAATSCASARATLNQNNNSFFMTYVDVDSDATTFDSSSATVSVPSGGSVLFATLTWGGNTSAGTAINSAAFGTGTVATSPTPANAGQVKLMVPGAGSYQTVNSTRTSFLSGSTGAYQGYADVTSLVQAAGNGSYTVANVQTGTGGNEHGGWGLTIAYANPTDPPRNLTVFSGFGSVMANNVVDLPVSGFQTPPSGSVKTTLGAISYEGDAASTGDQMQLANTTAGLQNVTDALHPAGNTFTSVISDAGADTSTRSPKYLNQLGYDAATFTVNGFLGNNTTSADIRLTSGASGETYYPGVITFATDLYSPSLTATKSVAVVHKATGNTQAGVPEPGDTLRYTIDASNTGADAAKNTVLTDTIPTGTTYVAGSLTSAGAALTDATGDDVGSYSSGTNAVTIDVGTGATASTGGIVNAGASAPTVTFDVTVNGNVANGAAINNTAQMTYAGNTTGIAVTGASNAVTSPVVRHHSALAITKSADVSVVQRGSATPVTYTLTATNSGPYDDPAVTVTDNLPSGAVVISATPSSGTCTTPAGHVVCAVGAVANGASATVAVVVNLDAVSDPATDTATVAGSNVDDDPSDNSASRATAVNSAPVAHDDTATTSGGVATISVLANDSDPDGDPLAVTPGSSAPAKGSIVVNPDRTITYTANPGAVGPDSFSYLVSDGRGGSATATVTVTIPDAAPHAQADAATTSPGAPVTVPVLDNDTDPNIPGSGQALSVTSVTQPAAGKGTVTTDGSTVTFTPAPSFGKGTATFTYTVSDGAGGTDTGTVTVTIPNDAPVAAADSAATGYLTPITVDVLANDSDDNGDPLTVTAVSGAAHGTATITGSGTSTKVHYVPDAGWSGSDTLTYTISDGTTTATGQLTITTADAPPAAGNFSATVDGGVSTLVDVLAHASDPNGDSLTVIGAGPAGHGTVSVDPSGKVVYTPDPAYAGADSFSYTVSDGHGGTDTGTVSVTVRNQAPVAHDDAALVPVNGSVSIDVLGNDTDPNADALSIASVGTPSHGVVVIELDGTLTYTPDAGYLGDDSFTYDVSDGHGGTDTATVSVTVANQPPVAVDDIATDSGAAGSPITVHVLDNDSDPNSDPLTIVSVSVPAHGTATIQSGAIVYTAAPTYAGPDAFTYTISDGRGGLSTATVTIDVQDHAPVAIPDTATASAGMPVTVDVVANDTDVDGETLALLSAGTTSAHGGTIAITSGGRVVYTSATGFTGTDTFSYVVTDPRGGTDTGLVTVHVSNADPVASDRSVSTALDHSAQLDLLGGASDPDGQTLSLTSAGPAAHGTVTVDGSGVATYTPVAGYVGTDSFTYTISDGQGGSVTATVTVTITPGPSAHADALTTLQGTAATVDPLANDTPGTGATLDAASVVLVDPSDPSTPTKHLTVAGEGTFDVAGDGTITFSPDPAYTGGVSVTYQVTDSDGNLASAVLTATVTAVTPTAIDDTARTPANVGVTVDVLADDEAGNPAVPLDISSLRLIDPATSLPATTVTITGEGTYTVVSGQVSFVPAAAFSGVSLVTYTVADVNGTTASALLSVTVGLAPAAHADVATGRQGLPVTVDPLANDTAGSGATLDPASVVIVDPSDPAHPVTHLVVPGVGTYDVSSGGIITLTPAKAFTGVTSITYEVTDSDGNTASATVVTTMVAVTPAAAADKVIAAPGATVTVQVLDNDHPGDPAVPLDPTSVRLIDPVSGLPATVVTIAGQGTYRAASDGTISFTPVSGFRRTSTITYQVADANGTTAIATLEVNETPSTTAVADPDHGTSHGGAVTIDPLANDTPSAGAHWVPASLCLIDPTSHACLKTVVVPDVGTWTVDPDGTIVFTPDAGFAGTAQITYRATDSDGRTAESTLTVRVAPAALAAAPSSPPSTLPSSLPFTGAQVAGTVGTALLMLLSGAGLLLIGRRRGYSRRRSCR